MTSSEWALNEFRNYLNRIQRETSFVQHKLRWLVEWEKHFDIADITEATNQIRDICYRMDIFSDEIVQQLVDIRKNINATEQEAVDKRLS